MKRKVALIALLLVLALPAPGQDRQALPHQTDLATDNGGLALLAKPVARVNGAVLTQGDLLREMYAIFPYARQHNGSFPTALEPDIRRGALTMIEFEELVYQEAKRRQMSVSRERLAQAEKQFRKQFATDQMFEQFLQAENNNSGQVLRKRIERSLLIDDLLKKEVTDKCWVSLDEARAFYLKNQGKFKLPEAYDLQTITIMPPVRANRQQPNPPPPTPQQAKEMRVRAEDALRQAKATKSFEDFGILAEKISEDDYRVMMGEHKNVGAQDLPPEVLRAAARLQVAQVSDLIQAEGAYTIIRLYAHTFERTQTFDEVSQALRDQMRQQKTERFRRDLDANLRRSCSRMSARAHKSWLSALGFVITVLLLDNASLRAQVQVGSETQISLEGSVSAGYAGSMTNNDESSHGLVFGGAGNLSGSVYSPQFLSFDVVPFYNQSRNNSSYQSITNSSGVTATANVFGGSQFPGYFNYSRVYNNTSNNYVIPGLANYATNGDTQNFGVGWSANLTNLPFLSFAYQQGSANYSLLGTQQESFSDFHSVSGSANYNVDGWHLNGGIHYLNTDSIYPQFLPGPALQKTTGDTTTYTFNMSRAVDGDGNTWLNFIRTGTDYNFSGLSQSETSDVVNGGVTLKATSKLTTTVSGNYIDNLWGSIFQQVTSTGATVPVSTSGGPSHSWSLFGNAQYAVLPGLYVEGIATHQQQSFEGTSYSANAYGGSVFYGRQLLGGQFSAGATVTESSYGTEGGFHVGLLANATYIRRFGEWNVSGNVGYSRDTQTILIAYTSSGYSYSVSVNRRIIHHVFWNGTANASKSTFGQSSAYSTFTQGYSTGLAGRWLSVNGAYAKSSGNGLLTAIGVTPLPPGVPPILVPTVLYGGRTYSVSVGSTPIRGLTFSGVFIDSRSYTARSLVNSNNLSTQAYAYLTYQVRKIYFDAGYSRLLQGFTASGLPPSLLSTYYVGLSRWFKAF